MKQLHTPDQAINYIFIGIILCFICSCRKFLDIPPPKDQIQTQEIFKNDQAATSSVTGLYSFMLTSSLWASNGGMTVFPGLSADEIYPLSSDASLFEFSDNELHPENGKVGTYLWSHIYQTIYHTNMILDGLQQSTGLSEGISRQLKGEALLTRAFHFFYLLNLYGAVPLATTTDYELNSIMQRSDPEEIKRQIELDLEEAKSLLISQYPTAGRVRPNKSTATAFLARFYLYQNDWARAEAEATEVIDSEQYSLVEELNDVFLANSTETIWSLMQETTNTSEAQTFIPSFSFLVPNYGIRDVLLNAFEPLDERRIKWVNTNDVDGQTYYYPYKYKKGYDFSNPSPPVTEYYVVLRLAEQYLIRAEARARQNDVLGSQADLDTIRARSGLAGTVANDIPSLLSAIEHERRIELFAEWGHRWFDLKRWSRTEAALHDLKSPNWSDTDLLYPIPTPQILANPFLVQNDGY